ncbi:hypothetical protein LIA77_03612 [Sarocladium implicatum]|nr:hypothetical protein LIA77_03612 [Sarocladium implicatum]
MNSTVGAKDSSGYLFGRGFQMYYAENPFTLAKRALHPKWPGGHHYSGHVTHLKTARLDLFHLPTLHQGLTSEEIDNREVHTRGQSIAGRLIPGGSIIGLWSSTKRTGQRLRHFQPVLTDMMLSRDEIRDEGT